MNKILSSKVTLDMDAIVEAYKNRTRVLLTEEISEKCGFENSRIVKIVEIEETDEDNDSKVYFKNEETGKVTCLWVNQNGTRNSSDPDSLHVFESLDVTETLVKKYEGKAYEEIDVQPGDEIESVDGSSKGTVISIKEAFSEGRSFNCNLNEVVFYKTMMKPTKEIFAIPCSQIKKISNVKQPKQEEEKIMNTGLKLMHSLQALGNRGTDGVKTGVGAITSDEIVALFHKHFDDKLPSWWKLIPNAKNVEALVIPGLVYVATWLIDNKYAKKVQGPCLEAWQGKAHDLTKSIWTHFRPFIKELSELVQNTEEDTIYVEEK